VNNKNNYSSHFLLFTYLLSIKLTSSRRYSLDNNEKKSHLAKLSGKLNDFDSKLDELKAKAVSSAGTAKAEYEKTIDDLRKKRKEAEEHLKKLKTASEESWNELKRGTKKTLDSMSKSINNAIRKFKK
jgi:DNA anti-recombination protein RmuC